MLFLTFLAVVFSDGVHQRMMNLFTASTVRPAVPSLARALAGSRRLHWLAGVLVLVLVDSNRHRFAMQFSVRVVTVRAELVIHLLAVLAGVNIERELAMTRRRKLMLSGSVFVALRRVQLVRLVAGFVCGR